MWKEDEGSTHSLPHLDLKLSSAGIFSPCRFLKYLQGQKLKAICGSPEIPTGINNMKQESGI